MGVIRTVLVAKTVLAATLVEHETDIAHRAELRERLLDRALRGAYGFDHEDGLADSA